MPIDPNNPTGAGGPPSGGSPPNFDPTTQAHFDATADKVRDAYEFARKHGDQAERLTNELYKQVKVTDKEVDAYKEMIKLLRRKRDVLREEWKDTKVARKDLERIAQLQEEALKNTQRGTREYRAMAANLKTVQKLIADMPQDAQEFNKWMNEAADTVDKMSHNVKEMAKAISQLGRKATMARGIGGIFEAMGIGKFGTNVDRRLEKIEEIKQAVADSREMRKGATLKHMMRQRTNAIDEMREQAKNPKAAGVDQETGRVMPFFDEKGGMTAGGRHTLAQKLGFKPGTKKYKDFISGEEAMGAPEAEGGAAQMSLPLAGKAGEAVGDAAGEAIGDTVKSAGAGWTEAMSEGGGAMEALTMAIEGGMDGLMAIAPEIIVPLEVLAEAIKALSALFEMYLKQNQEMEKGLGKGGLFTAVGAQPGINHVADAFAAARDAMNTRTGIGAMLGINWERNLAMASAAQDAGYAPFQSMTQGGNQANQAPGAMGEFMHGAMGEIQRIVVGAGRVGGLTDQEGLQQVFKLLTQYRETIASSEDFMNQLNKDTQAAGISTSKYLQIIDEVSGHFDRMGKSLEQVTGVMRELSRYGDVSSETLKDMMDTLATATQQTNVENLPTAAFVETVTPKDLLEAGRSAETGTLRNYVAGLQAAGGRYGIDTSDVSKAIDQGDLGKAEDLVNGLRTQADKITDDVARGNFKDTIDKINSQIARTANEKQKDPLARASGEALYGSDLAIQMRHLFTVMRTSTSMSGIDVQQLLRGGGGATQTIMVQKLAKQLGMDPSKIMDLLGTYRRETSNVIKELPTMNPDEQRKTAKSWLTEFARGAKTKGGIPISIMDSGLGKYWKGNMDDTVNAIMASGDGIDKLVKLANDHLDVVAGSSETQDRVLESSQEGFKAGAKGAKAALETARGITFQTTSVTDMLKNVFQPLMIELVKGIDAIAKGVSWLTGKFGDHSDVVTKSETDQVAQMSGVGKGIDMLNATLDQRQQQLEAFETARGGYGNLNVDDRQKDQAMQDQIAVGVDMLKNLRELQNKGMVTGADQSLVDALTKHQAMGKDVEGHTQTINNYFSSDSTMNVAQDSGPSTSTAEQSKPMKATPARIMK